MEKLCQNRWKQLSLYRSFPHCFLEHKDDICLLCLEARAPLTGVSDSEGETRSSCLGKLVCSFSRHWNNTIPSEIFKWQVADSEHSPKLLGNGKNIICILDRADPRMVSQVCNYHVVGTMPMFGGRTTHVNTGWLSAALFGLAESSIARRLRTLLVPRRSQVRSCNLRKVPNHSSIVGYVRRTGSYNELSRISKLGWRRQNTFGDAVTTCKTTSLPVGECHRDWIHLDSWNGLPVLVKTVLVGTCVLTRVGEFVEDATVWFIRHCVWIIDWTAFERRSQVRLRFCFGAFRCLLLFGTPLIVER